MEEVKVICPMDSPLSKNIMVRKTFIPFHCTIKIRIEKLSNFVQKFLDFLLENFFLSFPHILEN
jgi:hypothetical protein